MSPTGAHAASLLTKKHLSPIDAKHPSSFKFDFWLNGAESGCMWRPSWLRWANKAWSGINESAVQELKKRRGEGRREEGIQSRHVKAWSGINESSVQEFKKRRRGGKKGGGHSSQTGLLKNKYPLGDNWSTAICLYSPLTRPGHFLQHFSDCGMHLDQIPNSRG